MGTNDTNLPTNCLNNSEAIQYLASVVASLRLGTYTAVTGSPTLTAAQMVGGVVEISGGAAATVTTDTAANIITRMTALDANAGVGSTATFRLINDNSGTLTITAGTGVTAVGIGSASIAAGVSRGYIIKILTTTTVSVTAS